MPTDNSSEIIVVEALERSIRAEQNAEAAHDRLDRMNGSIDRLADASEATAARVGQMEIQSAKQGVKVGMIVAIASTILTAMVGGLALVVFEVMIR